MITLLISLVLLSTMTACGSLPDISDNIDTVIHEDVVPEYVVLCNDDQDNNPCESYRVKFTDRHAK